METKTNVRKCTTKRTFPCNQWTCAVCGAPKAFFARCASRSYWEENPDVIKHVEITLTPPSFNGDADRQIGWNLHLGKMLEKFSEKLRHQFKKYNLRLSYQRWLEPFASGGSPHVHFTIPLAPGFDSEAAREIEKCINKVVVFDNYYEWDLLDTGTGELTKSSAHKFGRSTVTVREVPEGERDTRKSTNGFYVSKDLTKSFDRDEVASSALRTALRRRPEYQARLLPVDDVKERKNNLEAARKSWRNLGVTCQRVRFANWPSSIKAERQRYGKIRNNEPQVTSRNYLSPLSREKSEPINLTESDSQNKLAPVIEKNLRDSTGVIREHREAIYNDT